MNEQLKNYALAIIRDNSVIGTFSTGLNKYIVCDQRGQTLVVVKNDYLHKQNSIVFADGKELTAPISLADAESKNICDVVLALHEKNNSRLFTQRDTKRLARIMHQNQI